MIITIFLCVLTFIAGYCFRIVREVSICGEVVKLHSIEDNADGAIIQQERFINENMSTRKAPEKIFVKPEYIGRRWKLAFIVFLSILFFVSLCLGIMIACSRYGKIIM